MLEEKQMQDNDYNERIDQNNLMLHNLRKESADTQFIINEKNRHNNLIQGEIGHIREQISRRE